MRTNWGRIIAAALTGLGIAGAIIFVMIHLKQSFNKKQYKEIHFVSLSIFTEHNGEPMMRAACDTVNVVCKYNSDTLFFIGTKTIGYKPLKVEDNHIVALDGNGNMTSIYMGTYPIHYPNGGGKFMIFTETGFTVFLYTKNMCE